MICMKNLRFSSRPRAKVRCQGPPGSARAQPWAAFVMAESWQWLLHNEWWNLWWNLPYSSHNLKFCWVIFRGCSPLDFFCAQSMWTYNEAAIDLAEAIFSKDYNSMAMSFWKIAEFTFSFYQQSAYNGVVYQWCFVLFFSTLQWFGTIEQFCAINVFVGRL